MDESTALLVGIDWAMSLHQVCVLRGDGSVVEERQVAHRPEALAELCARLRRLAGDPAAVHVALELKHGPLIDVLVEHGFAVYGINPKQVDRFRDRFSPSGSKDDRRDALVLAKSLRTDREAFQRIERSSPWTIQLRELSRMRRDLVREQTKHGNRLRAELQRFYPAFLELFPDPSEVVALELWLAAPTPDHAQKVRKARLQKILERHRIRRFSAEEVQQKLREASYVVAPGTVEAVSGNVKLLVERLQLLATQRRGVEQQMERHLSEPAESEEAQQAQRDAEIMRSMPGIGTVVCAALQAEAARPLRARDYHALRSLTGVAPVTKCSGKKHIVKMRTACHGELRTALYHWALIAVQREPRCKARYQAMRERNVRHAQALRSIADSLLRILCAMLRDGTKWGEPKVGGASAA